MDHDLPYSARLAGFGIATAVRCWMSTLDFKVAFYDTAFDPAFCERNTIFILWHEYIPFPVFLRPFCGITMLLGRHKDADLLAGAVPHFGYDYVRGSTSNGGSTALRELVRKSRGTHLGMTPDGPRGPRRVLSQGPVYLASKLCMPLVCMGFGYDRPRRLNSWDRFAVPRLFSRARSVFSPAMHIPAKLDCDSLEHYRLSVENMLNRMTAESEAWAESGTRKVGEMPFRREPAPFRHLRRDSAHAGRARARAQHVVA